MAGKQLGLFGQRESELRRDAGIERAASHADRESEDWQQRAFEILRAFAVRRADAPWLCEDLVLYAASLIEEPPTKRAWGAVVQRAQRSGLIERCGYALSNSSNRSPMNLWRLRAEP